jgi:ectoine hydroxylase-related dioxygenase (phytanoyl-CoA dioxygenase family)
MDAESLSPSRTICAAQLAQFRETGLVKLAGLLAPSVVEQLRGAMTTALSTFFQSPVGYDITALADAFFSPRPNAVNALPPASWISPLAQAVKASGLPRLRDKAHEMQPKGHFLVDSCVWRRVPGLAAFAAGSELPALAAAMLDTPRVRFYGDQIFVKEPGAADRAAFHQDLPYFHLAGQAGCVFWIPLDSVRRGGGALGYIPGSHRWGRIYNPNILMSQMAFPGSVGADLPNIEADPSIYNVRYVEAEPGDVIVYHFLTVHGSEGNLGDHIRRAFSLRYCDADLRFHTRAGAPRHAFECAGMRDGDRLADTDHPVVWPPARSWARSVSV